MKNPMKKIVAVAVVVAGLAAFAEPSVEITKVKLADARDGTVECAYTVSGDFEGKKYNLIVRVSSDDGTKSAVLTNENIAAGSVTTNLNVKTLLGKAYPGVSFFAKLEQRSPGGVQLWEGGPFFAECNVGATKPEEYGYYFWWGDTVGYVFERSEEVEDTGRWVSVADGTTTVEFEAPGATAGSNNRSFEELRSEGWIGEDNNLVSTNDAATVHCGAPWRMPTKEELNMLADTSVCTTVWTNNWNGTGVNGRLVKGVGAYASNSIFLPAAGDGRGPSLGYARFHGNYWSSTPVEHQNNQGLSVFYAAYLFFSKDSFSVSELLRYLGGSIRAVRGSAE